MRFARAAALGACLAAAATLPSAAAAQDPAGYAAPFQDTFETRVLPLFAMMRTADGWAQALRGDAALRELSAERAARVSSQVCLPVPQCLADAWTWNDADIATVEARLRSLMDNRKLARALVDRQMRPSGRFARHGRLDDADFVAVAWREAAAAVNQMIAVYAKGAAPRYPAIDAIIFDAAAPAFVDVLIAHGQITGALARDGDLFFEPAQRYATGLLQMNERIAADLYARGLAPFIVVSGGNVHPNRTPFNEAIEMKRLLIEEYGVRADRVLIEPLARHTTTNLRNCARLLLAAGFPVHSPALIVSDHKTIQYIGSKELADRNLREMGVQPGTIAPGPNRFSLLFTPDPIAFHVEATDPLDP